MAEIKYESKIGQINANATNVYAVLTNLENLQKFKDHIPQDKVKEIEQLTKKVSEEPEKQLQEIKKCAAEILEEL